MARLIFLASILACFGCATLDTATEKEQFLPNPGEVLIDLDCGEIIFSTTVQHPEDKPCIDDWGRRVQAFIGCREAAGGNSKMEDYFVFLTELTTEKVCDALIRTGAKPRVHYNMEEGHRRSGLTAKTEPEDYLQGDPVLISIFWKEEDTWVERPYQDFVMERVFVEGQPVIKPWTPSFVFHGSGAIHNSGTGCIACPCDCAGGIIADNRFPLYDPKPEVKFNWNVTPEVGTRTYVRIRTIASK